MKTGMFKNYLEAVECIVIGSIVAGAVVFVIVSILQMWR